MIPNCTHDSAALPARRKLRFLHIMNQILTAGHQTRCHSRSEQHYCHLLLAVYFRNCYKTGVAARTLSGLRSRQNLTSPNRAPSPLETLSLRGLSMPLFCSRCKKNLWSSTWLKTPGPDCGRLLHETRSGDSRAKAPRRGNKPTRDTATGRAD